MQFSLLSQRPASKKHLTTLSAPSGLYLELESCKSNVYDFLTSQNGLQREFNKCHTCIQRFCRSVLNQSHWDYTVVGGKYARLGWEPWSSFCLCKMKHNWINMSAQKGCLDDGQGTLNIWVSQTAELQREKRVKTSEGGLTGQNTTWARCYSATVSWYRRVMGIILFGATVYLIHTDVQLH